MEVKIHCAYDVLIPIEDFIPHERNTNNHPDKQIEALAKVINRNGIRHPIIVSKLTGKCVAGHGRYAAYKKLGIKEIPVNYQEFNSLNDEYVFLESDNHIARYAEFDQEKFIDNIKELELEEIDFEEFGLLEFKIDVIPEVKNTNEEIDLDNFGNDLEHTCPKCGFEFND